MGENPRFELIEQIGHGQFSNVYKAIWINAPLTPSYPHSPDVQKSLEMTQQPAKFVTPAPPLPPPSQCNEWTDASVQTAQFNNSRVPLDSNSLSNKHHTTNNHQALKSCNNNNNYVNRRGSASSNGHNNVAAFNCGHQKYVALKRIKFYEIQNSKLRMDCLKEVKLLQQLRHPNIINYNTSFIERNELFIVLELADGGDLSKLITYFNKKRQFMTERLILKYFTQVCSAVKYIHSKRILHRDIKPANIFMTSDGCVKLGDFGLGRFFSQNTRDAHSIVGTFYYMSPERIRESGYGFSSDIWSLGCVLYELITLNSPFSIMIVEQQQQGAADQHQQQQQNPYNLQWLIDRITKAEFPSLDSFTDISLDLRQLTNDCLNPNPDARPTMDYICAVVSEAYHHQQQQQQQHHHHRPVSSSCNISHHNNNNKCRV